MTDYRSARPDEAADFAPFTFPAYRHLLNGIPSPILLRERSEAVQPLTVAALADGRPVGLALVGVPLEANREPGLLSLLVAATDRRRGIGAHLLTLAEESVAALGHDRLRVVYTTGSPGVEALERLLARGGWEPPQLRMASVRLSWESFRHAPWLGRYGSVAGCQSVLWSEVPAELKEEARHRHHAQPWIHPQLPFWLHDAAGFEPATSLGILYHGRLVGWVINHRHDQVTLRFTCGFIRDDLARLGLLLPSASESFHRMPAAGFTRATFTTPRELGRMIEFIERWVRPWADFVGETRGSAKRLRPGGRR